MSPEVKRIYNKHINLYSTIRTILKCLDDISGDYYPSPDLLIDVLKGYESKAIIKHCFNKCPEYGKLFYVSKDDLKCIINWLIKNQFIFRIRSFFPELHPSSKGRKLDETITAEMLRNLSGELRKAEERRISRTYPLLPVIR